MKKERVYIPVGILFCLAGWVALTVISHGQDIAVLFSKEESVKTRLIRIEKKLDTALEAK